MMMWMIEGVWYCVIFFDCDDCLYKNDWCMVNVLMVKIELYMM